MRVLDDLRGGTDAYGNPLSATVVATADELASAGDLVKGKAGGLPVAVVRGLPHVVDGTGDGEGARAMVRVAADDMFRLGTSEAVREAVTQRRTVREFTDEPVDRRRGAAGGRRGRDRARPAPHHAVAVRAAGVGGVAAAAARRDAGRVGRRPAGATASEESIAKRVRRGDVLRNAPYLVVPCLVMDGSHTYGDARRDAAEREMFVVADGRRASRTSWSRWPASGSARPGCRRRCSAGMSYATCWTARQLGSDGRGGRGAPGGAAAGRGRPGTAADFIEVR